MTQPAAPGGTFYADPGQLKRWSERAAPGDWVIYATGPALDPRHPAVVLVADLIRTGEGLPAKARGSDGALQHRLCRAAPDRGDAAAATRESGARRLRLEAEFAETAGGRILMLLSRCANLGLPCPANRALADHAGLRDAEAARYQLGLLIKAGHITARVMASGQRVVTVRATGRSTLESGPGEGAK